MAQDDLRTQASGPGCSQDPGQWPQDAPRSQGSGPGCSQDTGQWPRMLPGPRAMAPGCSQVAGQRPGCSQDTGLWPGMLPGHSAAPRVPLGCGASARRSPGRPPDTGRRQRGGKSQGYVGKGAPGRRQIAGSRGKERQRSRIQVGTGSAEKGPGWGPPGRDRKIIILIRGSYREFDRDFPGRILRLLRLIFGLSLGPAPGEGLQAPGAVFPRQV